METRQLPARGPEGALRTRGRYELKEQLAIGGMGVIHRAYDRWAKREVAYKQLRCAETRSLAWMTTIFQREYDTLARLPHPNIVEVYDYGESADGPYYVMELLSGDDLTRLAPLSFEKTCRVMRDIASALALIHARKLVHRDVSPNNVRLTSDGRAKLIDFGALIPFGEARELIGTPAFIPPEALENLQLDQRSDLYSLGAVMYWALTQKMSVRARSIEELQEYAWEPALAPSVYMPEIPPELDALVLSMLSRDPLQRPQHAVHVIERLTAIANLAPELDGKRVAYSYLAHPPLIGRDAALSELERAVQPMTESHGQVFLVESAAGLGRTALLDAVARRGQLLGATVLKVRGDDHRGPFGVARKLWELALALHPEIADALGERVSFMTPGTVAPALTPKAARSVVEAAERHAKTVSGVQAALLEIARQTPLVIVIDDLHLSDPESIALLASLTQETGSSRLSMLAGSLSGHTTCNLPSYRTLSGSARILSIAALSEEQVFELVQALFGRVTNARRLAQWLHEQSRGLPSSCLDLIRLLLARGDVRYTQGTFTLPHDIASDLSHVDVGNATLARLGDLPPDVHRVACSLCLHEGALTAEQLTAATGRPERDVTLALEELIQREIVVRSRGGFSFATSSLRSPLSATLPDDERNALHVRLARALLADGEATPETRLLASSHLLAAGREDEAAATVADVVRTGVLGTDFSTRWNALLEPILAIYRRQGRSKEECLHLLLPLVRAGFFGDLLAHQRNVDLGLTWMAHVCGMLLARKLRPFLGGKLSFAVGLIYASLRRRFTPAHDRIGTLKEMLTTLVSLVAGSIASAVSAFDPVAARRHTLYLEPLAVLPPESSAGLMRQFSLASADVGDGHFMSGSRRFAQLIPLLAKPIRGLDVSIQRSIYLGCLNGRAQAELNLTSQKVLELADALGRGDPFFGPHAECARMAYHGYRGDLAQAQVHRERAELLALRDGTSWSAVTVLTIRRAYMAIMMRDAVGLMETLAELDRLSEIAPKLRTCKKLCEANLELLRGRAESAVSIFESVIDTEGARRLASWRTDRLQYAVALTAAGHPDKAKTELVALQVECQNQGLMGATPDPTAALALAEAALGNLDLAGALLDEQIVVLEPNRNALQLGSAHRDRAQVAILAKHRATFDQHLAAMTQCFRATQNPLLLQQCDALLAQATRAGLRERTTVASTALAGFEELAAETVVETLEQKTNERGVA